MYVFSQRILVWNKYLMVLYQLMNSQIQLHVICTASEKPPQSGSEVSLKMGTTELMLIDDSLSVNP